MTQTAPQEIERKFLVKELPQDLARGRSFRIEQGYLAVEHGGAEVRLRRQDGEFFSYGEKRLWNDPG